MFYKYIYTYYFVLTLLFGIAERPDSCKLLKPSFKGTVTRFCACTAFWVLVWQTRNQKLTSSEEFLFHRPWEDWESYYITIEEVFGSFWKFQTTYFVFSCKLSRNWRSFLRSAEHWPDAMRRNLFIILLILKKQLKFMLNFALFCWDYLHTYSLYVPVTGQALYADICKFRLGEQRDQ